MRLKSFIGLSSVFLIAWLAATYLHQVPSERYPHRTADMEPLVEQVSDTEAPKLTKAVTSSINPR